MSSFGIGLGAFMDSLDRGMDTRTKIDANRRQKKIDTGLEQVAADTKAKFADPLSDEAYDYMMKRQELVYQQNGEPEKALAWRKFSQEDSTRRGASLFSSSLLKAQTGDASGALSDAIKAGQVKGYIDHGYEVLGQDEIKGDDGTVAGYRLRLKDPKGKEIQQDVAIGDIPRLVSTFANPDAAFQARQKQEADAASDTKKRAEGLEDYETKKQIDRKYDKPGKDTDQADYLKVADQLSKTDLDWAERSPEDQDTAIRKQLEAAKNYANPGAAPAAGAVGDHGGPPAANVIVDQGTGEQIDPAAAAAPSPSPAIGLGAGGGPDVAPEAIGLGGGAAGVPTPTPRPDPRVQATAAAPGGVAPGPAPAPAQRGPTKQELIQDAADYMTQGGNPQMIAQKLRDFGVSEQEWPTNVRSAIQKQSAAPVAIGLGQ